MKLVAVTLENFRAYEQPRKIELANLTTIIGRNDVGKSTILEALEIFFNNEIVKIEQQDLNVHSEKGEVTITAEFSELPEKITLDAGALTTLADEYLLSSDGTLVIQKVYDCFKKSPTCETFILAQHPTKEGFENLLELKEKELQALVRRTGLSVSLKGNPGMRQALWHSADDLALASVAIPVSKTKEDSKRIWEQIELHLPLFAIFQSDRQSKDSDGEIQSPLKGAVAAAIGEVQAEIEVIQAKVREKAEEIANLTHNALEEIDPTLAGTLTPKFSAPTSAKWMGLFSLGMDTDDDIPLNKRGSGVRRLVLVSFFKAEAERKLSSSSKANIIFAIEEPETSQHPHNQRTLIESLKELASSPSTQVLLTTHSPGLAADLPAESIRFVTGNVPPETPSIRVGADVFGEVANTLGLTPDSRVKLLICVEGPTDIEALRQLSHVLHQDDPTIPNLRDDPRCAFVPLGGSTLKHWVTSHYLREIRCPEVHIYDSDVANYRELADEVNSRDDGLGSWAVQTAKHEIECYLHADAIREEHGVTIEVVDIPTAERPSVPRAFAIEYAELKNLDAPLNDRTAKNYLSRAFKKMTVERIKNRDPEGEVEAWLRRIGECLQ